MQKLTKPWRVNIEMTFGCDNHCPMCFKQVLDKPKNEYDYLTPKTTQKIATELLKSGWDNLKIEFALRGEPTLNPYFYKNIQILRKILPKAQLTLYTNGNHLNTNKINEYFRRGGNIIIMDCYKNDLKERKEKYQKKFKVYEYYKDNFNPFHKHNPKTKVIVLMDSIMQKNKERTTRVINNQAGNIKWDYVKKFGLTPLKEPLEKKCVRPFRELNFLYDGTIVLCCHDSKPDYPLANIHHITNLKKFWETNKKLNLIRLLLFNKNRDFPLCRSCDDCGGMRQGLIPKMRKLNEQEIKKYKEMI